MSDYVPHVPVSTYVPTTDEIETGFHEFASDLETRYPGEYAEAPEFADWREAMHGFRRWQAALIREAKAEAWDEAEGEIHKWYATYKATLFTAPENPYREGSD